MRPRRTGVTLIELLILIAILGIMARIVVPKLTEASVDLREETLRQRLDAIRTSLNDYRADHRGALPQAGVFVEQLTLRTNASGDVQRPGEDPARFPLGPYLEELPGNPFVNRRIADRVAVHVGDAGGSDAGWHFNPETGSLSPDDDQHSGL